MEAPAQYLHSLVRRHPLLGLRHTAGYRARRRWSLRATARTLLDTRSYPGVQ